MKSILKIFLFLLVFSTIFYKSQKVTVRGIAKDSSKANSYVMVAVNDTIRKQSDASFKAKDSYHKLIDSKKYHRLTNEFGNYEIKAKLTDTLYFYKEKYYEQKYKVADIIKNKIKVELKPEPCVPFVACEQKQPSNFYIFVGEMISKKYEPDPYYCNRRRSLDNGGMKYTYKIKDNIYGDYPKDTIEFKSYSHLGRPMIELYDAVLLFVVEYCGKLYQEKYQFFDLYKTKDGRWASPGDPYKFDNYSSYEDEKTIKAQPIDFDPLIRIDVNPPNDEEFSEGFQKYKIPYYRLIGDKAVPLMGTYIKDLIRVKMGGTLKKRNINLDMIK